MLEYLLLKRKEKDWIFFEKFFMMVVDILNVVKFLYFRDIVYCVFIVLCFFVWENGLVYLLNLVIVLDGYFLEFIVGISKFIIIYCIKKISLKILYSVIYFLYVLECIRIFLRWFVLELILYDKYSKESDVYMVG